MGEVLLAGEETQEGTALPGVMISDSSAERGVAGFEGVEDGTLGDGALDLEGNFTRYFREGAEVGGEFYADGGLRWFFCVHLRACVLGRAGYWRSEGEIQGSFPIRLHSGSG